MLLHNRDLDHCIRVGKLRELLAQLPDDDYLIPVQVGNLAILRGFRGETHGEAPYFDDYLGFVDLGFEEVKILDQGTQ